MTTASATFEQQYEALCHGRGVVELTGWSSVTLTGADRQTFLNNFCTNDVMRLAPGTCCEAFVTNVKGKILGHGLVTCRADELVFIGTPGQVPRLIEHLDRFVIREDVQLRDTTTERNCLLAAGDCGQYANAAFLWNLVGSQSARVLAVPPALLNSVKGSFNARGFVEVESRAFTAARIEAGMPLFGVDFGEHNFPQEVGRDREAISFTKGCYLGQETVARIDALGHVNQRLVGVRFRERKVPESGAELSHDGKKAGHVTSVAYSPRLQAPLALAMVRREANSPGTRLDSPVGACEVVSLPLATSSE